DVMISALSACVVPSLAFLILQRLKEQILEDFNNTMTSARSVASISSATSNGYRYPSQWSLKYDESPQQIEQPSS
ncbi:unnamed protein product, partial [Rotaria sp. Silwood1]